MATTAELIDAMDIITTATITIIATTAATTIIASTVITITAIIREIQFSPWRQCRSGALRPCCCYGTHKNHMARCQAERWRGARTDAAEGGLLRPVVTSIQPGSYLTLCPARMHTHGADRVPG